MRRLLAVAFLLLLACSSAFADPADSNKAHNMLMKLSVVGRNKAFLRYLKINKESCDVVVRNFYQGVASDGMVFWSVSCRNKREFSISIEADAGGSSKIMDCPFMKFMTKVDCFQKLKN